MANSFVFRDSLPIAPSKITTLESCRNLATKVDDHIVQFRRNDIEELMRRKEDLHYHDYDVDSYLFHYSCPRFGTDEGKTVINEPVRGTDVFVMVDMMNYSVPYTVSGYTNHMLPDDHLQNLKRIIRTYSTTTRRVNVVMPSLYESRQHRRSKREFLNCAVALEELATLGVENIITFGAHDPRVQNATPLINSDNFMPMYQFVKALFSHDSNIRTDKEHLMVISPDEGAMNRAVYLANSLGVDMGVFYRRRDYSQVTGGRNPVVAHEFLSSSIKGKTVLIVDDMISSDESMLDTYRELREHKTSKVTVCCAFGLFTNGLEKFDGYCHQRYLDYVITINLNYRAQELTDKEWYLKTGMGKYLVTVINSMNHNRSINASLSPAEEIQKPVQKRQDGGHEYLQKLV